MAAWLKGYQAQIPAKRWAFLPDPLVYDITRPPFLLGRVMIANEKPMAGSRLENKDTALKSYILQRPLTTTPDPS